MPIGFEALERRRPTSVNSYRLPISPSRMAEVVKIHRDQMHP